MTNPLCAAPFRRARRGSATLLLLAGLAAPVVATATPAGAATAPCALPADTVAPQLHDLTLTPSHIDVSHSSQSIGVSAEATDTSGTGVPSGVAGILVIVTGPDGSQRYGTIGQLHRVSGDATDGMWKGRLGLPRYAPAGIYQVTEADAVDVVGNLQSYGGGFLNFFGGGGDVVVSGGAGPLLARVEAQHRLTASSSSMSSGSSQAASATTTAPRPAASPTDPSLQPGWQPQVTVSSARPPGSTGGPTKIHTGRLTSFTARPETVDTYHAARRIRVRASLAGHRPQYAEAFFDDAHAGPDPQFSITMRRHGSSYSGSLRIPTWAGRESFHITLYAVYVGRSGHEHLQAWTPDQLAAAGFAHVVHVDSGVDHSRPAISSLTVTPDPVDSTAGRVNGEVTVGASDTLSGVSHVFVSFYKSFHFQDFGFIEFLKTLRLQKSGGRWVAPFSIGQCATGGTWKIDAVAVDRAGNYRELGAAQLAKLGLPSSLKVKTAAGDRTPPGVSDVTVRGDIVTVDFTEPVRNVTAQNLSLYARRPRADRYRSATPIDGITCYDAAGNALSDCSGATTPVSSADLTVSGLVNDRPYEIWANLFSATPQLTDVAGNPMDWLGSSFGFTAH